MMRSLLLVALLGVSSAFAQERKVEYREEIIPIANWSGPMRDVLGLFRGYSDPILNYREAGVIKSTPANLIVYQTTVKTVINKPANTLNLAMLLQPDIIQKFDAEIQHRPLPANETMPMVAGRGPVNNFKWCKDPDGAPYIKLADYELPINYMKPDHALCANSGRAVCFESCLHFSDSTWQTVIKKYNNAKTKRGAEPSELKDLGIGMQMEIRYFASEAEYGQNLRAVTGVSTPVRGVIEINMFYFNQVFQFGKIVAVFQDSPTNPNQTILSSLNALGVREKTWKKGLHLGFIDLDVGRVVQGRMLGVNTKKGLTAGVPTFTSDITKSIADILEK